MSLPPYSPDENFDLLSQLEASFSTREVGIAEFAQSHEFCHRTLYPRQKLLLKLFFLEELDEQEDAILDHWIHGGRNGSEIVISPHIRERTADLKSRGFKHFREVVLVGGRRCSKGFITGLSLAKMVYDLTALQDPGSYYGIDADKEIVFGCVAASQDQAKQMQYADFSAMVNSCKALQRNIFKLQELEFSLMTESDMRKVESWKRQNRRVQRDISKIRGRALPANSRSIRGMAAMALVFDEFAHFQQGDSDQSDSEVYAAAIPALAQFNMDGMIFANSSPFSKVGKLYERFEAGIAEDNGNPAFPEMLALQFPSWALYEGWWEDDSYIGPKKCITVSPDWNYDQRKEDGSLYYTEADRHAVIIARQEEKDDPIKYKVERRGRFAETVDAYLVPEMVDRMFSGRPVAYDAESDDWTYQSLRTNWDETTYELKYYAHLDPSSTTAGFGFALGHVEHFTVGQRTEEHVVFDIIKRWNPRDFKDHTIDWDPILEWLTNICYLFRPVQLTMDQYNSAYPITWLRRKFREKRIETRVFEKTAPQPLDAKLLTPHGWITMNDVKVGTQVIGSDGCGHEVTGVYPKGEMEIYRVVFADGSSTECSLDHLWRVRSKGERGSWQTLTLAEILDRGLDYGNSVYKWRINHVPYVEFAPQIDRLPLDPYLLGCLLGDGTLSGSVTIACHADDVDEQETIFSHFLPTGMRITRSPVVGRAARLRLIRPEGVLRNPIVTALTSLGLRGVHGRDKFIPNSYMLASVDERIRLLQGLIDTDGHVGREQYRLEFTTTSPVLARQVKELVGSLGGSACIAPNKGRTTLTVCIKKLPYFICPTRLTRKATDYRINARSGAYRYLAAVEYVGQKQAQCISVDVEDHLYVTDDYILTHNTAQTNWDRAEIFRTAINRGLIHAPADTPDCMYCIEELKFLQEIKTSRIARVEKQDTGPIQTKDLADCVMTVTEVMIGDLMAAQIRKDLTGERIVSGAPGGYPLGGQDLGRGAKGTPLADFYSTRRGEQMVPINARDRGKANPAQRVAGGRPIPRRLPGW